MKRNIFYKCTKTRKKHYLKQKYTQCTHKIIIMNEDMFDSWNKQYRFSFIGLGTCIAFFTSYVQILRILGTISKRSQLHVNPVHYPGSQDGYKTLISQEMAAPKPRFVTVTRAWNLCLIHRWLFIICYD